MTGAMIATSGDEAFVLFAMVPRTAVWMTLGMIGLALVVAPLVDLWAGERRLVAGACDELVVHEAECECFPRGRVLEPWACWRGES